MWEKNFQLFIHTHALPLKQELPLWKLVSDAVGYLLFVAKFCWDQLSLYVQVGSFILGQNFKLFNNSPPNRIYKNWVKLYLSSESSHPQTYLWLLTGVVVWNKILSGEAKFCPMVMLCRNSNQDQKRHSRDSFGHFEFFIEMANNNLVQSEFWLCHFTRIDRTWVHNLKERSTTTHSPSSLSDVFFHCKLMCPWVITWPRLLLV